MDQEVLIRRAQSFSLMQAEVVASARRTSSRDYRLTLKTPEYREWEPGQFVMLRWGRHVVGRPFAIVDWKAEGSGGRMEVWIRRLGAATEELYTSARAGMPLFLTAPLGLGLPPPIGKRIGAGSIDGRILFLSGGVGAASVLPLARKARARFWVHGEREGEALDSELMADKARPDLLYFETQPPPGGHPQNGRITESLQRLEEEHKRAPFTAVVSCGPSAMLDAVAQSLASSGLNKVHHWLGLEEKMGCGVGLCFSCSVSTRDGMERCCLEGPWFQASHLKSHFEFRKTGKLQ